MRGTQSLLHICVACWKRPELLGRELLWRWAFGLPAAAILYYQAARIAAHATLNPSAISLNDPVEAGQQLAVAAAAIKPEVERAIAWLGPLLAAAWAIASGLGRSALLRRTLDSATPNLVAWSAWVICLSLGIFVLWALLSWIFSIAPLLAMLEGRGVFPSLARSLHLGPLRSKLVEINLVLGIVRLALIVLAIVFSAIPLPFTADMTGTPLYLWWAFVTLLYLLASDFFQVARLAAFVDFWRIYHPEKP